MTTSLDASRDGTQGKSHGSAIGSSDAPLVRNIGQAVSWVAWACLLVSLPVTTFPFVARTLGGGQASPLAGLPLIFLVAAWLVPNLVVGGRLPSISKPLLCLGLIAAGSGAAAIFLEIYPAFGQDVNDRIVRGLITLGIGMAFYLVASKFPRSDRALRYSLMLLYIGAALMLVWATVQAYVVLRDFPEVPDRLNRFHRLFSMRDMSPQRVSGFAFEPSWLADLLIIVYIPLWLASVIRRYSVFTGGKGRLTVELVLLIWGSAIFFVTFSRIGYVAAFLVVGAMGLTAAWKIAGRLTTRSTLRVGGVSPSGIRLRQLLASLGLVILLIAVMLGLVYAASAFDKRIARLFTYDYARLLTGGETSVYSFANRLAYAERLIYWAMGFRAFSLHPLLGVGLGDIGFFFSKTLPGFGYGLVEMIWLLEGKLDIPNAKNLWVRLLGETGIAGFAAYLVWLGMIGLAARELAQGRHGVRAVIGLAGLMALLAQLAEGFSLDSFALPQFWIITGLVTAALGISFQDRRAPLPSSAREWPSLSHASGGKDEG